MHPKRRRPRSLRISLDDKYGNTRLARCARNALASADTVRIAFCRRPFFDNQFVFFLTAITLAASLTAQESLKYHLSGQSALMMSAW